MAGLDDHLAKRRRLHGPSSSLVTPDETFAMSQPCRQEAWLTEPSLQATGNDTGETTDADISPDLICFGTVKCFASLEYLVTARLTSIADVLHCMQWA